jgi:hypothetical protein
MLKIIVASLVALIIASRIPIRATVGATPVGCSLLTLVVVVLFATAALMSALIVFILYRQYVQAQPVYARRH